MRFMKSCIIQIFSEKIEELIELNSFHCFGADFWPMRGKRRPGQTDDVNNVIVKIVGPDGWTCYAEVLILRSGRRLHRPETCLKIEFDTIEDANLADEWAQSI